MAPLVATQHPNTTTAAVLAALTALGGTAGYARRRSLPSLIAGLSVGALYGAGAYQLNTSSPYGTELSLLASVVLAGSSIPRAIKTGGKPLPVGLALVASYGLYVFGTSYKDQF